MGLLKLSDIKRRHVGLAAPPCGSKWYYMNVQRSTDSGLVFMFVLFIEQNKFDL